VEEEQKTPTPVVEKKYVRKKARPKKMYEPDKQQV
jgi:hypothetical protein